MSTKAIRFPSFVQPAAPWPSGHLERPGWMRLNTLRTALALVAVGFILAVLLAG